MFNFCIALAINLVRVGLRSFTDFKNCLIFGVLKKFIFLILKCFLSSFLNERFYRNCCQINALLKKNINNNENVIVIFADLLILYARIVI